ncbi:MAG: DUF2029 domain-containing protein, partial [Planctomycetes bacterium]|nr:DUF2029 domain-containing protein [Planctomycetota bacterium]
MPIPKWLAAPRLRAALPWFCGLLAAAIAAKNLVGGYGDLGIYLDAAREFRQGGIDLYRDRAGSGPWAYPPFVALPFAALQAALPDGPIRWLYCLLLGLGTALLLGDLARALRPFGGLRWWQWLAFGLLFQRCIAQNLTHGQLSLWVGTCVARGVVLLQRGSDRAAGVAFGLAAALKLTPLLFLLALPCMRRPRAALAMAMTVAVAWFVAPWPFCGAAEHLRHFGDFGRTVAGSLVARGGASIVEAYAGPP